MNYSKAFQGQSTNGIEKTPVQKWCYSHSIGKIPFDLLKGVFINQ